MEAQNPQIGDVIADKYRIESKLGGGGMGTVFCATHLMTGRRFALKWMNSAVEDEAGARERFIREFQTAGSIMHPNVAAVLDVGSQSGSLFIIMEYLAGESLAARIARGPMQPTECVPIVIEAMRGVAAAHDSDIVHRDLKPDNIFICESAGRPRQDIKVLDFGIVKAVNARAQQLPTITARGIALGTPPYMAPEQVLALPGVDHRVDIYAFGVILYEALSGHLPFAAPNGMRLLEKIVAGAPPSLGQLVPGLPPELESVVMRALAREPGQRFSSLREFAERLLPWAGGARRITPGEPVRRSMIDITAAVTQSLHATPERAARTRTPPERGARTPPDQPAVPAGTWSASTQRLQLPLVERRRQLRAEHWLGLLAVAALAGSIFWTNLEQDDLPAAGLPTLMPRPEPLAVEPGRSFAQERVDLDIAPGERSRVDPALRELALPERALPEPALREPAPQLAAPAAAIVAGPAEPRPHTRAPDRATGAQEVRARVLDVPAHAPERGQPARRLSPPRAATVQPAAPPTEVPHRAKHRHKTSGVSLSDF